MKLHHNSIHLNAPHSKPLMDHLIPIHSQVSHLSALLAAARRARVVARKAAFVASAAAEAANDASATALEMIVQAEKANAEAAKKAPRPLRRDVLMYDMHFSSILKLLCHLK
jgi:hypothetical protein